MPDTTDSTPCPISTPRPALAMVIMLVIVIGSVWASFRPTWGATPSAFSWSASSKTFGTTGMISICYSDRIVKDDMTHRLQTAATGWRDVNGMTHERLADQVRADRIDILFDLAGHTAHNRLLVFVRKPRPSRSVGSAMWAPPD